MSKNKIETDAVTDLDHILDEMKRLYQQEEITDTDGVKIDFAGAWVHLRKSNTEPVIRIYSEAPTKQEAEQLAIKMMTEIKRLTGSSIKR
jgi:phosphomannomutase